MKNNDNDEDVQMTLDQITQTIEVMTSVVDRLRHQLCKESKLRANTDKIEILNTQEEYNQIH